MINHGVRFLTTRDAYICKENEANYDTIVYYHRVYSHCLQLLQQQKHHKRVN